MYLTKVTLDIRHPSVRQALRDANDMHRNVMAGFSESEEQKTVRSDKHVLYRLFSRRDRLELLIASEERPDVEALARRGFHTEEALIRDISALRDVFTVGRCLRFELLASPCKKVGGDCKNSRREFLWESEKRMDWLRRKGESGGFQVLQASEISQRIDVLGRRAGMQIKHSAMLFSGVLCITDAEAFWKCYTQGIGPGKAYGLGMLNVASA